MRRWEHSNAMIYGITKICVLDFEPNITNEPTVIIIMTNNEIRLKLLSLLFMNERIESTLLHEAYAWAGGNVAKIRCWNIYTCL